MNVLLTGATGFVGQHFLQYNKSKYTITAVSVRKNKPLPSLSDIDVVVHLGGKAHEMQSLPDEVYFTANAELTKQLAMAAKAAGVQHFIYVSSVKVYGNIVSENIDENTFPNPDDAYGRSKLLGEQYVQELNDDNFIVSIVRPPLVYGSYVKGNMLKLLHLAQKQIPLPLGNINNKRSIVFVDNLLALINQIIQTKRSGVFIAGDKEPVSTTLLISLIRKYSGKKKNLIYIPDWMQAVIRKLRYSLYIRLFGSFVISNSLTNKKLNFEPPYSTEEGIRNMVNWFKITL